MVTCYLWRTNRTQPCSWNQRRAEIYCQDHGETGHCGYPETGTNAIDSLIRALSGFQKLTLPWSEEFENSTLNIGKIEGGVAGNVIPASAYADGVVRIAARTLDETRDSIRRMVEEVGPNMTVEFEFGIGPVPIDYDVDGEFSPKDTQLQLTRSGFETVVLNYGTDIPFLKGNHKRYLYGPGSILDVHSSHEHLKVAELEQAVQGYKTLISQALDQTPAT
ncbi:acetylornithine deacetylase [Fusarium austroafricanum]|uniref:Acetylornithine deacetylase n=1 Tax=Fusarium austroafricanum TaxID=2364996 RepID=A0A8H4NP09_9HYPO|nr:acetylornithine deacetylase [Fusarium austroafricanum]